MNVNYPVVTAPLGDWPMRCIFTDQAIELGQRVALCPLGFISLLALTHRTGDEPVSAAVKEYGLAVLRAYICRRGELPPAEVTLHTLNEALLIQLWDSIEPEQTTYIHQLLQQTDLNPWLTALNETA